MRVVPSLLVVACCLLRPGLVIGLPIKYNDQISFVEAVTHTSVPGPAGSVKCRDPNTDAVITTADGCNGAPHCNWSSPEGKCVRNPVSRCKISPANGAPITDVFMFHRAITDLILAYPDSLGANGEGLGVMDFAAISGAASHWYGCPHYVKEVATVVMANDLDAWCIGARCAAAYQLQLNIKRATFCLAEEHVQGNVCVDCAEGATNLAGDDPAGDDTLCDGPVEATGKDFYHWKLDRGVAGRPLEVEAFHAPSEAGNVPAWKQEIIPMYNANNFRIVEDTNGVQFNIARCETLLQFKDIMLSGTTEERGGTVENGILKHKQDYLDMKCLMLSCNLQRDVGYMGGRQADVEAPLILEGPGGYLFETHRDQPRPFGTMDCAALGTVANPVVPV